MMKKLIKDLTLVNWLPNLQIILRGLLNNTEVNAANIKKVSSDIDTTNKKVGKIEGEVEVLREGQEVIKTDVEELKKGGGSVEVDETYLTKDEEGKITFGNNGTVGNIESPIIIVGEREGVTSLLPGSVIVEKPSGEELKLTPDSLELTDGVSSSYYSSRGISYQKEDERTTFINLPESTGETYNLPLIVDGKVANEFGVLETGYEDRIVALENTPSGINPENIGFGLSYTDDKIQLGERLEGLEMDAFQVYKKDTAFVVGNLDKYVKGEKSSVFINSEDSAGFNVIDGENQSNMMVSNGYSGMTYTNGVDTSSILLSENHLGIFYNNDGIEYNYDKKRFDYSNGEFNGEIATRPFVEDYVSKNGTSEVGEVHDALEGIKFRVLNYAEDYFMIGDFEKASQGMGTTVMVSDKFGVINFACNNENGTNQASVGDVGFTVQNEYNSGILSSVLVGDGIVEIALQNPDNSGTYLRLGTEEILMNSIYKKYNSTTNSYEDILMEGAVASAKYVDTKVEELTAIIADLQKQIEELKKS